MKTFKKIVLLIALGAFCTLSANELYIFETTEVQMDDKKGKLYIGTPVNVIKNIDEKNVLVEVSGVAFGGELYTNKNKSLIMASSKDKTFGLDGEKKRVTAVIDKGYLLDDPVEIWEEHEEFYYENCTQCHAAHEPKTHSMLEWDAILQTMNGFAQLYPDEANYLARFVKATSNNGFYVKEEDKK